MGTTESSVIKSRGPAESSIDTSKLNPKVLQWLEDAEKYTSYSKEKADTPTQPQQNEPEKLQIKAREPELLALEKLRYMIPLFPNPHIQHLFAPNELDRFDKLMHIPDTWPMLLFYQEYQCDVNKKSLKALQKQEELSTKVLQANILATKTLHNMTLLGSELHNFESKLKSILSIENELKTTQERLTNVIKKTFKLVDAINDEEAMITGILGIGPGIPVPCPLDITKPYLRKDSYTTINLLKFTSFYLNRSSEELQRQRMLEDYWLETILPNWDNFIKTNPKFWRKGIPLRLRGHVWQRMIHNNMGISLEMYMEIQVKMFQQREIVQQENNQRRKEREELKKKRIEQGENEYDFNFDHDKESGLTTSPSSSPIITIQKQKKIERDTRSLIQRDLPRTFPELQLFKNSESDPYNQILKVLEATAYCIPSIGYVQGMSYVAAALLLYMNHYEAFVCFTNLMHTPFMTSVCRIELANLAKHSQLFQIIFAQYAPELYEHFNDLSVTTEHFLLEWWLTIFTKCTEVPLFSRILDCFFLEGEIVVHYVAVGMLKLYEKELLFSNFESCLDLLQQLPRKVNEDALFVVLEQFEITPKIQAIMDDMHHDVIL